MNNIEFEAFLNELCTNDINKILTDEAYNDSMSIDKKYTVIIIMV